MEEEDNSKAIREEVDFLEEKRVGIALMSVIVKHVTTTKYMKQVQPREFKPNGLVLRCADVGGKNSGDGKILANWEGQYKVKWSLHSRNSDR